MSPARNAVTMFVTAATLSSTIGAAYARDWVRRLPEHRVAKSHKGKSWGRKLRAGIGAMSETCIEKSDCVDMVVCNVWWSQSDSKTPI